MKAKTIFIIKFTVLAVLLVSIGQASVGSSSIKLSDVVIDNSQESIKKGAIVVTNICLACHNLNFVKYQDLLSVGLSHGEIDVIRGERGMNQHLISLTPEDAAKSLYGIVPPDLSTIAKSRKGKGKYVYTLLSSFVKKDDDTVDNALFPGIRMPDVFGYAYLNDDLEKEKILKDINHAAAFLEWASDPKAMERRTHGYFVLMYFVIFTTLLFFLKRKVWTRLPT